MSTFLVECDRATWQAYGFADKTIDESKAICEQIFAEHPRRPSAGLEPFGVAQFSLDLERALVASATWC